MDEQKILLYADDILLFLGNANHSLTAAMDIIKRFGVFSGLSISWEESVLLPVHELERELPESTRHLQVVESFKYLGINIAVKP